MRHVADSDLRRGVAQFEMLLNVSEKVPSEETLMVVRKCLSPPKARLHIASSVGPDRTDRTED